MIGEIILALIGGVIMGYLIFKIKSMIQNYIILRNIPEKIEKQKKIFIYNGKVIKLPKERLERIQRKREEKRLLEEETLKEKEEDIKKATKEKIEHKQSIPSIQKENGIEGEDIKETE